MFLLRETRWRWLCFFPQGQTGVLLSMYHTLQCWVQNHWKVNPCLKIIPQTTLAYHHKNRKQKKSNNGTNKGNESPRFDFFYLVYSVRIFAQKTWTSVFETFSNIAEEGKQLSSRNNRFVLSSIFFFFNLITPFSLFFSFVFYSLKSVCKNNKWQGQLFLALPKWIHFQSSANLR